MLLLRLALAVLLISLARGATPATAANATMAVRPNIVFLLADDMGYMDLGANNPRTFYETPHLDALARSGTRFTDGYSACPVCSPTRASIMTGRYPPRTGVTEWIGQQRVGRRQPAPSRKELALEEVTIAEAMRDAGYATFFAGKWHLGTGQHGPGAQGFASDLVAETGEFFPPAEAGKADKENDPKSSDRIADAAVRFISANRERPFFAYLPFRAPHLPLGARPDLVAKYQRKRAAAPPDAWLEDRGAKVRQVQNDVVYAAMIEQLDTAIGRVLAAIEQHGLGGRTIVVFTSDNGGVSTAQGQPTANVPLRAGKGWLYEGGIRVPWIIRAPGVTKAGDVCRVPAISNDFFPTLLDLAGLSLQPAAHRDGVSLRAVLGGATPVSRTFFWHYPHYGGQGGFPGGAMREGNWKLIEWYEDGGLELFDLNADPGERHNLAGAQPATVQELHAKFVAWRKELGGIMPTPNPGYVPGAAQKAAQKAAKKQKKKAD